jgi:hypothetical protein
VVLFFFLFLFLFAPFSFSPVSSFVCPHKWRTDNRVGGPKPLEILITLCSISPPVNNNSELQSFPDLVLSHLAVAPRYGVFR